MDTAAIIARLRAIEIECHLVRLEIATAAAPDQLVPAHFISLKEAAFDAKVSITTMRRWAVEHRIGQKFGTPWKIDRTKLAAHLNRIA